MGFSGNLENISLHQAVNLIHQGKRSGILYLDSSGAKAQLIFRFGNLIYGSSTRQKESIIDFLISQGIITADHRDTLYHGGTVKLSDIFQELSQAGKLEVIAALQARAKIVLFETLYWETGEFDFKERDVSEDDFPRIGKMMSEVERLEGQDLPRIIRLKQKIPHREMVFQLNPEYRDVLLSHLRTSEELMFRAFDGEKRIADVLPMLEGEELYNLLAILDHIESGYLLDVTAYPLVAAQSAWDQKFRDFQKVYAGCFKKMRAFFLLYGGEQQQLFFQKAFQEAMQENHVIWQTDFTVMEEIPLDAVLQNVQKLPLKHQIRILKNCLNAVLLWQLITLKNSAGKKIVQDIALELDAILGVIKAKGTINHKEIATEIPVLFPIAEDFPSWVEQGIMLFQLNRRDDSLSLLENVPTIHPDSKITQQYIEKIRADKLLAAKIEIVIKRIYKSLIAGNIPEAQKLITVVKLKAPDHPQLPVVLKRFSKRFDEIVTAFKDLSLVPVLRSEMKGLRDHVQLSQEQKQLLKSIDGTTDIQGLIKKAGFSKLKTLLLLYSIIRLGMVLLLKRKSKPAGPKPEKKTDTKPPIPRPIAVKEKERTPEDRPSEDKPGTEGVDEDDIFSVEAEIERLQAAQKATETSSPTVESQEKKGKEDGMSTQEKKAQADKYFSKGLDAMKEENYDSAIESFENAIKYFSAGVAYYQYLDQARLLHKQQITQNLVDSVKWYFAQKDMEKTLKYLNQALGLSPRNRELLYVCIDIYRFLEEDKKVEKALMTLIEVEPFHSERYVALGEYYLAHNDLVNARKQFLQALQYNKNDPDANRHLNLMP